MRSFGEVVRRARSEGVLLSALLELTHRCNLGCAVCYNRQPTDANPLSRAQLLELLGDLAEMQVLFVTFSGGEPLLHPHLLELGGRARELGFVVRIKTNGHLLHGRMAEQLKAEVEPFVLEVSLHGARAETHDRQTRAPGSFERLMANLEHTLGLGLRVKLKTLVTSWNEDEIDDIVELAAALGVGVLFDPQVTPRDDGDLEPLRLSPSPRAVERLIELRREHAKDLVDTPGDGDGSRLATQGRHCGAGGSLVVVDPVGVVYPCVQWRHPLGSLHERSIKEIWASSPALHEVRAWNEAVSRDVPAEERRQGFCPGLAAALTGSPTLTYRRLRPIPADECTSLEPSPTGQPHPPE